MRIAPNGIQKEFSGINFFAVMRMRQDKTEMFQRVHNITKAGVPEVHKTDIRVPESQQWVKYASMRN